MGCFLSPPAAGLRGRLPLARTGKRWPGWLGVLPGSAPAETCRWDVHQETGFTSLKEGKKVTLEVFGGISIQHTVYIFNAAQDLCYFQILWLFGAFSPGASFPGTLILVHVTELFSFFFSDGSLPSPEPL